MNTRKLFLVYSDMSGLLSPAEATHRYRVMREAGWLTNGGRGVGGPESTIDDCIALICCAAAQTATESANVASMVYGLFREEGAEISFGQFLASNWSRLRSVTITGEGIRASANGHKFGRICPDPLIRLRLEFTRASLAMLREVALS